MEISCVAKTSAAEEKSATIFVALELSKKRWLIAVHSPIGDKISCHGVAGGDTSALLALISRYRRQVEEHLERPVRVLSCYEAFNYPHLSLRRFRAHHVLREMNRA